MHIFVQTVDSGSGVAVYLSRRVEATDVLVLF